MEIDTIGIDLGKTLFHLVGLNAEGEIAVRRKLSRKQLLHFTANLHVRLIGMESCGGAPFLGRALREQGHDVRLMPAQYVKPYVKTNKNDYIDAEAIAEAVGRPKMRFVPIKSDDQLDMQSHLVDQSDSRFAGGARHHHTPRAPICRGCPAGNTRRS
jgi:transposase